MKLIDPLWIPHFIPAAEQVYDKLNLVIYLWPITFPQILVIFCKPQTYGNECLYLIITPNQDKKNMSSFDILRDVGCYNSNRYHPQGNNEIVENFFMCETYDHTNILQNCLFQITRKWILIRVNVRSFQLFPCEKYNSSVIANIIMVMTWCMVTLWPLILQQVIF